MSPAGSPQRRAPCGTAPGGSNPSTSKDSYVFKMNGSKGTLSPVQVVRKLSVIDDQPTRGAIPAHVILDSANRFALVANYIGANFTVLPIASHGGVGPASDVFAVTGKGPNTGRRRRRTRTRRCSIRPAWFNSAWLQHRPIGPADAGGQSELGHGCAVPHQSDEWPLASDRGDDEHACAGQLRVWPSDPWLTSGSASRADPGSGGGRLLSLA
jgi:lactonase family protein with 7-bladed beta-propeller